MNEALVPVIFGRPRLPDPRGLIPSFTNWWNWTDPNSRWTASGTPTKALAVGDTVGRVLDTYGGADLIAGADDSTRPVLVAGLDNTLAGRFDSGSSWPLVANFARTLTGFTIIAIGRAWKQAVQFRFIVSAGPDRTTNPYGPDANAFGASPYGDNAQFNFNFNGHDCAIAGVGTGWTMRVWQFQAGTALRYWEHGGSATGTAISETSIVPAFFGVGGSTGSNFCDDYDFSHLFFSSSGTLVAADLNGFFSAFVKRQQPSFPALSGGAFA